jgi:hypothetical protein
MLSIGQGLSTRLECSLPFLLYKTQARYEEDLRRIHEVKPVVSTATLPRISNDEIRARVPSLTRRISHLEISERHFTSPSRKAERSLIPPAQAYSHARSPRVQLHLPGGLPGKYDEVDSQSVSMGSSGTEQDDAERRKDEQENLSRRLKELGRMMSSNTLGFARPTNNPTTRRTDGQPALEGANEVYSIHLSNYYSFCEFSHSTFISCFTFCSHQHALGALVRFLLVQRPNFNNATVIWTQGLHTEPSSK